jgi:nicotinate dehydrogenase subunit B
MSQPAVRQENQPSRMVFPVNLRPLLAGWNLLFRPQGELKPEPARSAEWNRGRYLVDGLGHCGACHTPRNAFGAGDTARLFGGASAEGWYVPAIGAASQAPVGWTEDAYVNYLFDGWDEHHGIAAGPMAPVIDSMSIADEDDIFAMAVYLASLSEAPAKAAVEEAVAKVAALDWGETERPGGPNAPTDPTLLHGEEVYFNQCVKCHKARISKSQPASLGLTAAVNAPVPDNLLHTVVHGIQPARSSIQRVMPAQGEAINDADMVALAHFVRWRFTDLPAWTGVEEALARSRAE